MALFQVIKFDGVPNKEWIMYKYPGQEFYNQSKTVVKQNEKNKKIANRGIYAIIIAAIVVGLLCWFFLNFT